MYLPYTAALSELPRPAMITAGGFHRRRRPPSVRIRGPSRSRSRVAAWGASRISRNIWERVLGNAPGAGVMLTCFGQGFRKPSNARTDRTGPATDARIWVGQLL